MKTVFQPNLTLAREPDGEFTLHAVTLTPNTSFSPGSARRGPPPNVRILPEVEPVVLQIRHHGGISLQVLTPVRHILRDLDLRAKTSVLAFAMLDGRVVGSTSIPVAAAGAGTGPITTSDWAAWMDLMPPGPSRLHVQGVVQAPTPGYTAALRPAALQGINPRDLILDLEITPPAGGFWPQLITPVPVSWVEEAPADTFDTVLVRIPDAPDVQLGIEKVY